MACPSFEDLVRDRGDHAAHCEECRALLEAYAEVDATLEAAFAGVAAPRGLIARAGAQAWLQAPLRRPTWVPEILDFVAWAAVLTLAVVLFPQFFPAIRAMLAQ